MYGFFSFRFLFIQHRLKSYTECSFQKVSARVLRAVCRSVQIVRNERRTKPRRNLGNQFFNGDVFVLLISSLFASHHPRSFYGNQSATYHDLIDASLAACQATVTRDQSVHQYQNLRSYISM